MKSRFQTLAAAALAVCCVCGFPPRGSRLGRRRRAHPLGVAGPQSGDLASYGIPSARAAELVVREVNAKGGVLGRQVKLLVEDDVCKPEIAATPRATRLGQGGRVLGHICSGAAKAALGIYRDAGSSRCPPPRRTPN